MHWLFLGVLLLFIFVDLIGNIEILGYIHVLAAIALVVIIIQLIQGRNSI